jgi:agmatine deiminase
MNLAREGWKFPAEWAPHEAMYTAWPAHAYAWGPHLPAAQREFVAFARAFAGGAGEPAQEPLIVLADAEHMEEARAALAPDGQRIQLLELSYGDVWLRDTAPLWLLGPKGRATVKFAFNGWGSKYIYPHDDEVGPALAGLRRDETSWSEPTLVLEGGAIDVDGEGTLLTTRSCVLHPNRWERVVDRDLVERLLATTLAAEKVIWVEEGLANDHTDGHIDNIARFVAPGRVVCMEAKDDDDPNRHALQQIAGSIDRVLDAKQRPIEVVRIPSPGKVLGADGAVMPASYLNFIIGNARVVMPAFGTAWDEPARAALQAIFTGHVVVARSARALLEGGGTFHCMTQQLPKKP